MSAVFRRPVIYTSSAFVISSFTLGNNFCDFLFGCHNPFKMESALKEKCSKGSGLIHFIDPPPPPPPPPYTHNSLKRGTKMKLCGRVASPEVYPFILRRMQTTYTQAYPLQSRHMQFCWSVFRHPVFKK